MSELGRREDALAAIQEAVEHYRRLAQARPDAFLPDVAMSLYNLALRHAQDGAGGALALARAHEAVSAYAVLADRHGDVFLGDLRDATALVPARAPAARPEPSAPPRRRLPS